MIKERIHVKDVGALKDTWIVELQPLTVLIGNSASGKSTLMKLVVLMRYIFKRICQMSYVITHSAVEAFGRPRMVEAVEAGEDGAEVSCPAIEALAFAISGFVTTIRLDYKLFSRLFSSVSVAITSRRI